MNFKVFFELLEAAGYRDELTVEIFNRGLDSLDPLEAARRAFRASSAVLTAAGERETLQSRPEA